MKWENGQRFEHDSIRNEILRLTREKLPHMVGQSFADVIEACLRFDEITKGYDELGVHREFKVKILEVLKRLATAKV